MVLLLWMCSHLVLFKWISYGAGLSAHQFEAPRLCVSMSTMGIPAAKRLLGRLVGQGLLHREMWVPLCMRY